MELFVVRLAGLDVALADSRSVAEQYARRHCDEDPRLDVEVVPLTDDSIGALLYSPVVAEATTA